MVVWIIGLAGSGKTTLGKALTCLWKPRQAATVMLDGDHFRHIMGNDLGHSQTDREKNGWRFCRMCHFLDQQSINVIACILSNFPEQRVWNRSHYSNYLEVFIDTPMEVLTSRDQKQLYSGVEQGRIQGVVGMDIPFAKPTSPDIVVSNDGDLSQIDTIATQIMQVIEARAK